VNHDDELGGADMHPCSDLKDRMVRVIGSVTVFRCLEPSRWKETAGHEMLYQARGWELYRKLEWNTQRYRNLPLTHTSFKKETSLRRLVTQSLCLSLTSVSLNPTNSPSPIPNSSAVITCPSCAFVQSLSASEILSPSPISSPNSLPQIAS